MAGLPTVLVKLDDGSGTFPFDITQFVRMVDGGISWKRGRPDQYQALGPGELAMTLENNDGRFTQASFTYNIQLNQKIRYTRGGVVAFTGRIQSLPTSWPTGGDEYSVVNLVAIDDMARAAKCLLRSSSSHEILVDNPAAYYPLGEIGGITASDITGNPQVPRLFNEGAFLGVPGGGTSSAVFGTSLGLPDGSTGVQSNGQGLFAALFNLTGAVSWTSTNSVHFDIVVNPVLGGSTAANVFTLALNGVATPLTILSGGIITFGGVITTGAILTGGHTHVLSINGDATATDLWVDGVKVATGAGISGTWSNAVCTLSDAGFLLSGASLLLGHLNFGAKLSDARVLSHHTALLTDFLGETPTARITRIAGYANLPVGTLDTSGNTLMGPTLQAGRSADQVLQDITDATQGIVYVDANGAVSNITGRTVVGAAIPSVAHDASFVSEDTVVDVDMAGVVNSVTGTASGSDVPTIATNPASIVQHGVIPLSYTWNVSTDQQAADLTNWQINTYPQPVPRAPTLTYDVLSMSPSDQALALQLELGVFSAVTGMPSMTAGGTTLFNIVEGISETISDTEWTITTNVVKHTLFNAWILDSAAFSVLGTSTKLSY